MRPSLTRTSRSSQPHPQPRQVTERNTCSPLTPPPALPARPAGTPDRPSPPATPCSPRRPPRSRRRCRSAGRSRSALRRAGCRPGWNPSASGCVARGVTATPREDDRLPVYALERRRRPSRKPSGACFRVKREERQVRAPLEQLHGRGEPRVHLDRPGHSRAGDEVQPVRGPRARTSRATAAASASARPAQGLFRRKQPGTHEAAAVAEAARAEVRASPPAVGRCRARARDAHRPGRRPSRVGRRCAAGGTGAAPPAVRDARPRCRGRRPSGAASAASADRDRAAHAAGWPASEASRSRVVEATA